MKNYEKIMKYGAKAMVILFMLFLQVSIDTMSLNFNNKEYNFNISAS